MEDRFKFRAWDPTTKLMNTGDCGDAIVWNSHLVCEGDHILMQSTGQKDIHGDLWWEGDIVEIDPEAPSRATIVWEKNGFKDCLLFRENA